MAQPFDADRLQLTGDPTPIADHVSFSAGLGRGAFSVSETGVLTFRSGGGEVNQPTWVDRTGKQTGSLGAAGAYLSLCLSPDEKQAAVDRVDPRTGSQDIWLFDLVRGIPSRFTAGLWRNVNPLWSPDGSRIVFSSHREGILDLYQKAASGVGGEEVLLKSGRMTSFSPDGMAARMTVTG